MSTNWGNFDTHKWHTCAQVSLLTPQFIDEFIEMCSSGEILWVYRLIISLLLFSHSHYSEAIKAKDFFAASFSRNKVGKIRLREKERNNHVRIWFDDWSPKTRDGCLQIVLKLLVKFLILIYFFCIISTLISTLLIFQVYFQINNVVLTHLCIKEESCEKLSWQQLHI